MPRSRAPLRPDRRIAYLLGPLLILGCANDGPAPYEGPDVPDAAPKADDGPAGFPPNLDAKLGLAGGSPCDDSNQCLSGHCTLGVCSDWAHAMKMVIDTTPTGADVGDAVTAFPLLVRLNAGNFAFAEARQDGADIRFLDSDGNNLNFEIENWGVDFSGGVDFSRADIWVLVPRIAGNSRDTAIIMYWGNPLAAPTSYGPSVFGDFACAFHMGEDPNTSSVEVEDDSGKNNTGYIQASPGSDLRSEGIIGIALQLDGATTFVATEQQLQALPPAVAVSIWFKTTTASKGAIAGFAKTQTGNELPLKFDHSITMDTSGRLSFAILHGSALATVTSLASYNDGQWHFVVARLSGTGQYLFVDGESVADDPTMTSADSHDGYWRFGEEPLPSSPTDAPDAGASTGAFFDGTIDEARVALGEPSDAWIKLSYATQRKNTTAVVFPTRP